MVANSNLKVDLMRRLSISQATLYKKAHSIRNTQDMEVEDSIYLLALMNGMKLKRYLGASDIQRVRDLQRTYNTSSTQVLSTSPTATKQKKIVTKDAAIKMPSGARIDDPLLPDHVKREAVEMAAIYPMFYYLENSIREFVCVAMRKYHGDNWWDKQVKSSLREKVTAHKKKESKNAWHQKRGDREVDYLDFCELKNIYGKIRAELVKDEIFPKEQWLDNLIDEVYESRCVIAHMNPLHSDNIAAVKVRVTQWNKLVKAKYKVLSSQ